MLHTIHLCPFNNSNTRRTCFLSERQHRLARMCRARLCEPHGAGNRAFCHCCSERWLHSRHLTSLQKHP